MIDEAKEQLNHDDIVQAIDTVKNLQKQWREIGFAGTRQESQLWQNFRSINDQVFAKRDELKSSQQTEIASLAAEYNQKLAKIKAELDDSQLVLSKVQAEELLNDVFQCKPVVKSVASAIESFIKEVSENIAAQDNKAEQENWRSLFCLFNKIAEDESNVSFEVLIENNSNEYNNLTKFWQKRLQEQLLLNTHAYAKEREVKTLEIEILAQVESPSSYAEQRLSVQISLMQQQMLSGVGIDLSQSLINWLRIGKLTATDMPLLDRLKKVYK